MPSMRTCPKCGEYHYHKSHSKNFYERTRKKILNQRRYRCHRCGYRGWERRFSIGHEKLTLKKALIYLLVIVIASFVGIIFKSILI
jgi:ribosomal protein L44E